MPLFTGSRLGFGKAVAVVAAVAADGGWESSPVVANSLRFNSGDSAYLNRTPSSVGNRKTFTFSAWIKRSGLSSVNKFFMAGNLSDEHGIRFESNDQLSVYRYSSGFTFQVKTDRVFRDPSAFFHLVVAYDSSQNTSSDRVKIYINGAQESDFATSNYPSQNSTYGMNNTVEHNIGRLNGAPTSEYFKGYLADVHMVDGLALDHTSFGEEDATSGTWVPKEYTGSYGTNGFHLKFDNTSDLGEDSSGNDNDFTANNLTASDTPLTHWRQADSSDNPSNSVGTVTYKSQLAFTNPQTSKLIQDHQNTSVIGLQNITNITSLRFRICSRGGAMFGVNTGAMVSVGTLGGDFWNNTDANAAWYTWSNPPSTLTSIAAYGGNSGTGNFTAVWAIEVNGVRIVDLTAADCDLLSDSPSTYDDGGNGVGNYATLNPLLLPGSYSLPELSNGNLDATKPSGYNCFCTATIGVSSGKYYWEVTAVSDALDTSNARPAGCYNVPTHVTSWVFSYKQDGGTQGLTGSPTFATYQTGDVIGIALNVDSTEVTFYKNGTSQGSGAYSYTNTADIVFPGLWVGTGGGTYSYNFGQRAFEHTPPTGYKAINTYNLDDTEILSGDYEGNGDSDGPVVWMNATPATLKIGTSDPPTSLVTFSPTTVDPLAGGFKIRNSSTNNVDGTTYYWIATTNRAFKYANAQSNE